MARLFASVRQDPSSGCWLADQTEGSACRSSSPIFGERTIAGLASDGSASARSHGPTQAEDDPCKTPVGNGRHGTERDNCLRFAARAGHQQSVGAYLAQPRPCAFPGAPSRLRLDTRQCPAFATCSGGSWLDVRDGSHNRLVTARQGLPSQINAGGPRLGERSSGAPCGMRHPSPAARAIRNKAR
jgi:hypothetical protein